MAVGNSELPELLPVAGVRLSTVAAGIKYPDRKDLVLIELAENSVSAGVFTQNAFCAAPVAIAKENLVAIAGQARYLLINTGNANAGTGEPGLAAARASVEAVASRAGVSPQSVLPFSTGVIGELLPVDPIVDSVETLLSTMNAAGWAEAAAGIMTTDTRPKGASRSFEHNGCTYTVTGIAKGAGMIRPNMATMLAYIATDAAVEGALLQTMLSTAVEQSFNRITVDSDTSTNDACILVATGASGNAAISFESDPLAVLLAQVLEDVCVDLATGLVRDAEGASKFVAVEVNGGAHEQECLDVAFTIAHSPLVKTALFASDPNWGRLLAAIGRAGLNDLDVNRVALYLNDTLIAENGCRAESYTEERGVAAMTPEEITIRVELNRGTQSATVWTSDFSYDYVRINAEYRT